MGSFVFNYKINDSDNSYSIVNGSEVFNAPNDDGTIYSTQQTPDEVNDCGVFIIEKFKFGGDGVSAPKKDASPDVKDE